MPPTVLKKPEAPAGAGKKLSAPAAVLAGLFFASVLLWLPNLFFAVPPPDIQTEYMLWLAGRSGPSFTAATDRPGQVCTNPMLAGLDNGYVCFDRQKAPGTLRIFCLGGSTTRGWPFHHDSSYPELLGLHLGRAYPGRRIEVVNAGFLASDTFIDLPLVRELAAYSPDIFLVYEGRNEAMNFPARRPLQRLLRSAHLLLDRNLYVYGAARRLLGGSGSGLNKTALLGLAAVAGLGSEPGLRKSEFLANIAGMAASAKAAGARAVFVTQAVYPPAGAEKPDLDGLSGPRRAVRALFAGKLQSLAARLELETQAANGWLEEAAAGGGIELLRMDEAFRLAGPGALLIEPPLTHPDWEGYCLMARRAAEHLAETTPALGSPAAYVPECPPQRSAGAYRRVYEAFGAMGYGKYRDKYLAKAAALP